MENKRKSMLSGAGFYTALTVCVLAAGVGGWFLLFGGEEPAEPPEVETAAPAPVITQEKPVETVSPTLLPKEEPEEETPPLVLDDTPVVAAVPRLVVSPLEGEVVAAFSVDHLVYSETLADWRTHDGMDIVAEAGTAVLAASAGTVLAVNDDALMGTTVVLDHGDGCQTTYANLRKSPSVEVGDQVTAGQAIGAVGDTAAAEAAQGPHLHFAVTQDGDAVDPEAYLKR